MTHDYTPDDYAAAVDAVSGGLERDADELAGYLRNYQSSDADRPFLAARAAARREAARLLRGSAGRSPPARPEG
jgi:hypothetical protein